MTNFYSHVLYGKTASPKAAMNSINGMNPSPQEYHTRKRSQSLRTGLCPAFVDATLEGSLLRIKEIQLQGLSQLTFRATALEEEDDSFFAVSLGFIGKYGYGSYGNGDGRFMSAMVHAAIEAWAPFAIILDLRELDYEFGNTIISAVTAGRDEDSQEWTTPTRIVTSEKSRLGLTTLLQYVRLDSGSWLFDTIEDAYAELKSLHEPL